MFRPFASTASLAGFGIGLSGGGGHIGAHLALGLASSGAIVVISGRGEEKLRKVVLDSKSRQLPGRIVYEVADASSDDDIERVLDRIESEAGVVRGWVNNAYAGQAGLTLSATRDDFLATVEAGLINPVMACQAALSRMTSTGSGSIVNIASIYGVVSPQPETYRGHAAFHSSAAYGAAKAGLIQFTRYAACHMGRYNVRVNAVSPGPFPAPAVQSEELFVEELRSRVPLARIGQPEELVGCVIFLLSDASSYVTGQNLMVDGGWTSW